MLVIEQALEIAARTLGSDQSRRYCLEMICADFLAGAHAEDESPRALLLSVLRIVHLLPAPEDKSLPTQSEPQLERIAKTRRNRLDRKAYEQLRRAVLQRPLALPARRVPCQRLKCIIGAFAATADPMTSKT